MDPHIIACGNYSVSTSIVALDFYNFLLIASIGQAIECLIEFRSERS